MLSIIAASLLLAPQLGPTMPPHVSGEIHALSLQIQELLSKSKFVDAGKSLKTWPYGEIRYEIGEGSPKEAEEALRQAVDMWIEAGGGKLKIVRGGNAQVVFKFIKNSGETSVLPKIESGVVFADIPLTYGADEVALPKRSFAFAFAKAFGMYLGLAPINSRGWVMGIDDRIQTNNAPTLTQTERGTLERIFEARKTLNDAIYSKTPLTPAIPRLEITPDFADAGTINAGTQPRWWFTLKNVGNATAEYTTETVCRCVMIGVPINVPPGKTVAVEAGLDTMGFAGNLSKEVIFHSNDPLKSQFSLSFRAVIVPEYRVLPTDVPRLAINDEGETDFHFFMYATPGNVTKVLNVIARRAGIKAEVESYLGEIFDPIYDQKPTKRIGFKISVTFLPEYKAGLDFPHLQVVTDSRAMPVYDFMVQTQKGIVAQPQSVYFGSIVSGGIAKRSFVLSHPSKPFKIIGHECLNGEFDVSYEPVGTSGLGQKVTVVLKDKKPGQISASVILSTDNPMYPKISVPIGGSIR